MKIALELQPCCWIRSGIGTYTYELVRRLESNDSLSYEGNVFNFLNRRDNSASLNGINIPINICKSFPYSIYRRIWNYIPIGYNQLFPKSDLSVFFNFVVPPRVQGKVITYIHDLTYLRFPETMKKSNLIRLNKGIEYSIKRSDTILTVSHFTKKEMIELLHIPEEKISIAYCAPSIDPNCADYNQVKSKFGIEKGYILFVGTIEPRKNVVRLLRAFELLKTRYNIEHKLVLAGGKGWRDTEFYKILSESKFSNDIVLTGFITNEEKNTLYKNATVFVFPSLYEGFGIPPLEAMTWGCPVVTANAASLPEVVGDAAVLVDPFDVDSIAKGIYHVISDKAYAEELKTKGCERAHYYTWEKTKEQFINACTRTLQQ